MTEFSERGQQSRNTLPTWVLAAFLVSATLTSWYMMMLVHEFGHVLGAWLSSGSVADIVWHPLKFSRTDLSRNPNPMFVVLAGPAVGSALPALVWLVLRTCRSRWHAFARGFAGFCLVANGAYLATAIVLPVGDTEDLVRLGAPSWLIALSGLMLLAGGLACWNGLRSQLQAKITSRVTIASVATFAVILVAMLAWSSLK